MHTVDRGSIVTAIFLIVLGGLFLAFSIFGLTISTTWPLIFFILAAGFFLPSLIWPPMRRGLAALFIPGSILLVLGLIFQYNTLTNDWVSWAYAWILLPGSVGLGLALASWVGGWSRDVSVVGVWLLVICIVVFSLFGMLFGSTVLKIFGPAVFILIGLFLLLRSFRRK
jgi:hypothetical protein